jgi:hypothetical protein
MCSLKQERSKKTKDTIEKMESGGMIKNKNKKEGGFFWLNCFSKWRKECGNKYHARIGLLPGMKITRLIKKKRYWVGYHLGVFI